MSFVKGTLLVAGGAAIGGVVAATATVKAIADVVKFADFLDDATGYPNSDEVVFKHCHDAETALDELVEIIARYGFASVADLYAGLTFGQHEWFVFARATSLSSLVPSKSISTRRCHNGRIPQQFPCRAGGANRQVRFSAGTEVGQSCERRNENPQEKRGKEVRWDLRS